MACIHRFNIDSHNIGTCSQCDEVRQYPWGKGEVVVLKKGNPSINKVLKEENMGTSIKQRHQYYEEHKEEIIADLLSSGRAATQEKWNIPRGGALVALEKRWLSREQRDAIPPTKNRQRSKQKGTVPLGQAKPEPPTSKHRLKLPEFSNEWMPAVQLKWLEVYEKLLAQDNASPHIPTHTAVM